MPRSHFKTLLIAASTLVLGATAIASAQDGRRGPGGGNRAVGAPSITLFDGRGFDGAAVTYEGEASAFGDSRFNDRASSLKVDGVWEICIDTGFRGGCQVVDRDVVDLGVLGLNNRISSARPVTRREVRGGPGRRAQRRGADIILFSGTAFTGDAVEIDFGASSLGELGFNDRATSIQVNRGEWLLCEHNNFRGRCEIVKADVRDLGSVRLNRRVSSIKPYEGEVVDVDTGPVYGGGNRGSGYGQGYGGSGGAFEGVETVFFPDVRGPRGGKIRAFADDEFCREQGLRRAAYSAKRGGFLTDVLCEK